MNDLSSNPPPAEAPPAEPATRRQRRRRRWFRVLVPLATVAVLLVFAELAARIVVYATIGKPRVVRDEVFGWSPTPDYARTFPRRTRQGEVNQIDYRTDGAGLRPWSPPPGEGARPGPDAARYRRILVVGDSFTQATDASNNRTWYGVLAAELGAEQAWGGGAGGWGTLQECLLLEREIDRLKPTLVILQMSSNDFANNDFAFERADWPNNMGSRRPYWEDGGIVYRVPSSAGALREWVNRHSYAGYFVATRLDVATAAWHTAPLSDTNPHQAAARATTVALVRRARERAEVAGVPFYVLSFAEDEYAAALVDGVCREAGATTIDGFGAALTAGDEGRSALRAADGTHLSEAGNVYAGHWLADWFRANPATWEAAVDTKTTP